MNQQRHFPTGFTWGAATAAYQIEGAVAEGGRLPSIWDTFSHTPGKVEGDDTGDIACDHYHRWEQDLDLIAELGLPSYRFSVAWSRVMPDGRTVNPVGLDFYKRLVDGLRDRGITPLMTLYHWDLPQALETTADSGWLDRDIADRFADYALVMGKELGDRIPGITTLNEPWCSAYLGYATGEHAPGLTDNALAYPVAHHLNLAHGRAVSALRSVVPGTTEISITINPQQAVPATSSPEDVEATRHVDAISNRIFLDPILRGSYPDDLIEGTSHLTDWSFVRDGDLADIHQPVDFLGVNYYNPVHVSATEGNPFAGTDRAFSVPIDAPVTTQGWPIVPSGLTDLLVRLDRDYSVPLVVTENGRAAADAVSADGAVHDADRIAYLDSHIGAVHDALAAGADIRGYYLWTLLDNFEWAWGFGKRFGMIHVDYETQVRTPKDSALWFRDVIARNGLA